METCNFCEKEIALAKFRLHSIQCARLNYKCELCGLVVLKVDKNEHEAEKCGKDSSSQINDKTAMNSEEESKEVTFDKEQTCLEEEKAIEKPVLKQLS